MDAEGLIQILIELGCNKVKQKQNNIQASCPFAPYGGHSGVDIHPSFTIKIDPQGESYWNCFACGRKGTLRGLLWQIQEVSGKNLQSLRQAVENKQKKSLMQMLGSVKDYSRPFQKDPIHQLVSDFEFEGGWFGYQEPEKLNWQEYQSCVCYSPYARKRGITEQQIQKWRLGIYQGRFFIPIFDEMGDFIAYSTRAIKENDNPKYRHSLGFKKDRHLYGEHLYNPKLPFCAISEGFFDVLRLDRAGLCNCYATMGTTLSLQQAEKLVKKFQVVFIFAHNDKPTLDNSLPPGLKGAKQSEALLKNKSPNMRVFIAPFVEGVKDVGDMSDDQLQWVLAKLKLWAQA